MVAIPESARKVIESGRLAHIVTINKDGSPQVTIVWVGTDGDELVTAHFNLYQKLRNVQRDDRVVLSIETDESNAQGLTQYLVVNGRASVAEGGALAVMDHLAQWYIGPGAIYPARDMPSGWTFRVAIDKIYGQGPWNDRWVEMDRASRGATTR